MSSLAPQYPSRAINTHAKPVVNPVADRNKLLKLFLGYVLIHLQVPSSVTSLDLAKTLRLKGKPRTLANMKSALSKYVDFDCSVAGFYVGILPKEKLINGLRKMTVEKLREYGLSHRDLPGLSRAYIESQLTSRIFERFNGKSAEAVSRQMNRDRQRTTDIVRFLSFLKRDPLSPPKVTIKTGNFYSAALDRLKDRAPNSFLGVSHLSSVLVELGVQRPIPADTLKKHLKDLAAYIKSKPDSALKIVPSIYTLVVKKTHQM